MWKTMIEKFSEKYKLKMGIIQNAPKYYIYNLTLYKEDY